MAAQLSVGGAFVKKPFKTILFRMFRERLICIESALKTLAPKIKEMETLNVSNEEEQREVHALLQEAKVLVKECLKNKLKLWKKGKCCEMLLQLENQILSFFKKVKVSEVETQKDNGIRSSKVPSFVVGLIDSSKNIKEKLLNGIESVAIAARRRYGNTNAATYKYDVFLSFRGRDTRESFTGTLFNYLSEVRKVNTFMDVKFRKGCQLEDLLKMIEKSRMSIIVFSENFAESEWCLKELAKIFQERGGRGHEVVPVFYKVEPSELRRESGKIKVHMNKHRSKYGKDSETVESWSNAIKELGNSSGYTFQSSTGKQEIELAKEIAQYIRTRLHGGQGYSSKLSPIICIFNFLIFLSFLIFLLAKFVISFP